MDCAPPIGTTDMPWSVKIPTTALSERFERLLVADPFHEHHRTQVDARGKRVLVGNHLLLVHVLIFTAHAQRRMVLELT